jgi:radial spoke head protein 1
MAEENKYTLTTEKGESLTYSAGYTGKGTAVYPNADVYDGDFVEGVRQGKGKYTYGAGEAPDRYEGQFFANEKHGIGKMFYSNKGEYFGI